MGAKYSDEDVCRPFLCGLCPHELFQLMKMEMRPCPKLHSLQLRKEYEEAKVKGTDNYDRDLEDTLRELMDECDGKIHVALQLLDDKDADEAIEISVAKVTETPEVMELSNRIEHKLREADRFDLERKTDFKIQALEQVEDLRTQRAEIQSMLLLDAFNKLDGTCLPQEHVVGSRLYFAPEVILSDHRKLHICDVCGSLLSVYDSGRRLAYHFMGKLHSSYMESRHKFAELQEAKKHKKRRLNEEDDDDIDDTRYTRPPYDSGIIFHGGSGRQNFDSYYTPFGEIYTIDAAFSSPYGHQAYTFMRDEYVVVDYAPPGTRIDKVVEGPFQTCCELPIFRCTDFEDSVDCAFRCKDTSEVWLFSEYSCVRIYIAPRSRDNEIIEGPKMVQDIFPCLKGTVFDRHLDAAFESSVDGEAYLFKGDRYALIRYSPERELIRIGTITEGFPCLRHTIFESDIGAAFTSHRPHEVYLFKRDYYALLSFTPGSTWCRLIGGVKEILPSWPSLRGILPRLSCFPDPDFHYHSGSEYESEYDQDDYRE